MLSFTNKMLNENSVVELVWEPKELATFMVKINPLCDAAPAPIQASTLIFNMDIQCAYSILKNNTQ
jgi:hypothetical protein